MVFCNGSSYEIYKKMIEVTILILIDGFLQYQEASLLKKIRQNVTILILIDGFLQ